VNKNVFKLLCTFLKQAEFAQNTYFISKKLIFDRVLLKEAKKK